MTDTLQLKILDEIRQLATSTAGLEAELGSLRRDHERLRTDITAGFDGFRSELDQRDEKLRSDWRRHEETFEAVTCALKQQQARQDGELKVMREQSAAVEQRRRKRSPITPDTVEIVREDLRADFEKRIKAAESQNRSKLWAALTGLVLLIAAVIRAWISGGADSP
jgi:hypothetical protein